MRLEPAACGARRAHDGASAGSRRGASQLKHITAIVSPEEYDAAVLRDPSVSTLAATGDMRTGRQLLADAPADRLRRVGTMAASPAGRAELDVFSALAERIAQNYGRVGPV